MVRRFEKLQKGEKVYDWTSLKLSNQSKHELNQAIRKVNNY